MVARWRTYKRALRPLLVTANLLKTNLALLFVTSFSVAPTTAFFSKSGILSKPSSSSSLRQQQQVLDPLVVCGPSGVGKGTLIDIFMKKQQEQKQPTYTQQLLFGFSVSHTTRMPRVGEVHGVHYHFTTTEAFQRDANDNKFVEYANVHGNWYGTSWQALRDVSSAGQRCLLDIDMQGCQRIKEQQQQQQQLAGPSPNYDSQQQQPVAVVWRPKFLFIAPRSIEVLEARLVGRGTESAETLQRRIANAQAELQYGLYPGNFDAIVVNDSLDQAVADFEAAVQQLYSNSEK